MSPPARAPGPDPCVAHPPCFTIFCPDENHDEDVEVRVICDASDSPSERLKAAILAPAPKKLLTDTAQRFVAELRAGGPALTEQTQAADGAAAKPKPGSGPAGGAAASTSGAAAAAAAAAASSTRTISMVERFHCRPQDIWQCLTHEGRVSAFSQSKATVEPRPGGAFSW